MHPTCACTRFRSPPDQKVLSGADVAAHTLEVGPGDEASLSPEDLATLASGPAAAGQAAASEPLQLQGTAAAATSSGPDGHAGAVFVLGSAFGSPGGAPMVRRDVLLAAGP